MTWTVPPIARPAELFTGPVRTVLAGRLDRPRATLLHKCAGLTAAQLVEAALAPSKLTLLGLVRHLTDVDRMWFRRRLGAQPVESLYRHPDGRPGASFDLVDPRHAEADLARLAAEWQLCRDAVADLDLDAHYLDADPRSTHMGETREVRLLQFHEENTLPVVGLREGAMLRIEDREVLLQGVTAARIFRLGREPVEVSPDSVLNKYLLPGPSH